MFIGELGSFIHEGPLFARGSTNRKKDLSESDLESYEKEQEDDSVSNSIMIVLSISSLELQTSRGALEFMAISS